MFILLFVCVGWLYHGTGVLLDTIRLCLSMVTVVTVTQSLWAVNNRQSDKNAVCCRCCHILCNGETIDPAASAAAVVLPTTGFNERQNPPPGKQDEHVELPAARRDPVGLTLSHPR